MKLTYPELTMSQMIARAADNYPEYSAYDFFDKKTNYRKFNEKVDTVAKALYGMGIRRGDAVTICMPNTPQAIDFFYGLNRIGAVANMVHPLSAKQEIKFYLSLSKSKMILTLDMFYEKVEESIIELDEPVIILVARMQDELPKHIGAAYTLTKGRPFLKYPKSGKLKGNAILWKDFINTADKELKLPEEIYDTNHTSVILYSGGTSGVPKGICLTDLNFNALAIGTVDAFGEELLPGDVMLACMPMFHGFGLGINIHTMLIYGCCCALMPNFSIKEYGRMLVKKRPNFIAGVPTIFEALLHLDDFEGVKFDFLKGVFSGGDTLSVELKKKVDVFLAAHGANVEIREGYGLTECVTASCLTPPHGAWREGSIGLPFTDLDYAIVRPGTDEVLKPNEEGEIIMTGPTVMLGYMDNIEETNNTLRKLSDGRTWLYTGDLGYMDEDGYVYFRQRIKRMIITNGYNVYPSQIENIIDSCEEVSYSCVIGVKDPRKMHRVKAYVVLRDGYSQNDDLRDKIYERLREHVAAYAIPTEIEFRKQLPKTLVGKVAYRQLEEEAEAI